jgi:hypothetical protein
MVSTGIYLVYWKGFNPNRINNGWSVIDIIFWSFTRMCSDGPSVSLRGSPKVSPMTTAACIPVPLPTKRPSSTILLALSRATTLLNWVPVRVVDESVTLMR